MTFALEAVFLGIPLVLGGDLLVLGNAVYLKTVGGLERVDVIYSRLADNWLDPLSFRRDSLIGVPGLIQCVREGTVRLANAPGAQLADDRSLLPFLPRILKYYLGERPILPQLETYWTGDLDQRELVLGELERFTIRPLYGEKIVLGGDGRSPTRKAVEEARRAILAHPAGYVAQPQDCDAEALAYHGGRRGFVRQDHIIFALRSAGGDFRVIAGALTRTTTAETGFTSSELGGGSKDTWVEAPETQALEAEDVFPSHRVPPPAQVVGSRSAEAFYWLGRYLERASALAGMIRVIETLEVEELNPTERTLYRPVWNAMLPPLENPRGVTRRGLSSPAARQRLVLDSSEPDSVASAIDRATSNASSVFDLLSLEAWAVIERLHGLFRKSRRVEADAARRASAGVRDGVPEFFAVAESTM
ncbi:MAG: circularly permuted type 2 ATP-grasp protein, partial [Terrimicrobiaceae bacterium]|nr:circularly permuted type 2 ATP-grasp protein [Terrimicrobiaceae bacterium]